MTSTAKVLISHQQVENTATLKYTSPPTGNGTWVDKFTGTNTSGATATLSIWLVPDGGVPGDDNLVVKEKSITAGGTDLLLELIGKFLDPGDSIHWEASAATSITAGANGRELTS
jgi:hypothetical protein